VWGREEARFRGVLESIRKEISAVREKACGQTEETNVERKNGTDVWVDG